MRITPDARLDDGELDVCVVGPVSRIGFLRSFPRVFKGTHTNHPAVTMLRGKVIELASLEPSGTNELYGSGERIGPLPARMEAVPGALRVCGAGARRLAGAGRRRPAAHVTVSVPSIDARWPGIEQ